MFRYAADDGARGALSTQIPHTRPLGAVSICK